MSTPNKNMANNDLHCNEGELSKKGKKDSLDNQSVDILNIDYKIKEQFGIEGRKLSQYKEKLVDMKKTIENHSQSSRSLKVLQDNMKELEIKIYDIESNQKFNFYSLESIFLLEKYKNILETPIQMSFTGKKTCNNKEKEEITLRYIEIAQKYMNIVSDLLPKKEKQFKKVICNGCNNKKNFDIIDNSIYTCLDCGSQQEILLHTSSYKDVDRANIFTKYTYDRKIHFRDCINQYQGKQNSTIDHYILENLDDQFDKHHLLLSHNKILKFPDPDRYKNITKEHIHIFLKELDYTKHYENINLIHYLMTGKKPDDIGYLEDKLMTDFDILTDLYDKNFKNKLGNDRKNFINTNFVLYQLLMKYRHPCRKEDFSILKTNERKVFHNQILRELFEILEWSGFNDIL